MIIENVLARLNQLEFELNVVRSQLAQVEEVVAGLRAKPNVEVKETPAVKSAPATPTTVKTSR